MLLMMRRRSAVSRMPRAGVEQLVLIDLAAGGANPYKSRSRSTCAAMLEKVRAAGAEVTMETKDLTIDSSAGPIPARIAFFKGPDGEVIELFENAIL